jgi:hypothetical protein
MKKGIILWAVMLVGVLAWAYASEHGGTPMGTEDSGSAVEHPSAEEIRGAMKTLVDEKSKTLGAFEVRDQETGKVRRLELIKIHDQVVKRAKAGGYYYSCADFKDLDTGETVDVDLEMENKDGALSVGDVSIHKVNGKARYTYDDNGNRIPVAK